MLYRNMKVPVPDDAHVYADGSVLHLDKTRGGGKNPHKTVIGHLVDPAETDEMGRKLMHPNDKYRVLYQDELGQQLRTSRGIHIFPPMSISVGLFALVLGIVYSMGIYDMLCDVYDAETTNALLDVVMYYILMRNNAMNTMPLDMERQLLFSIKPHDAGWYSNFFGGKGNQPKLLRDNNYEFMIRWVRKRKDEGVEHIAASVDGTNMDCRSAENEYAEFGEAKSHNDCPIVGSIEAVEAEGELTGMPVMYFITPGSKPDSVTCKKLLSFLGAEGLKVRVATFDRGFSYDEVMDLCDGWGIPWLMMLKGNYLCHETMVEKYDGVLQGKPEYFIEDHGLLYGVTEDNVQIFKTHPDRRACVGMFYNLCREKVDANVLVKEISREVFRLRRKIAACGHGEEPGELSQEAALERLESRGIRIRKEFAGKILITYDPVPGQYIVKGLYTEEIERHHASGTFCMASSKFMSAQEMYDDYCVRLRSELGFDMFKTQLDFNTMRVSGSDSFEGKYFTGHIAKMVRTKLLSMCRLYEEENSTLLDVNVVIRQLNRIEYTRHGRTYLYSGQTSKVLLALLEQVGITEEVLKSFGPLLDARFTDADIGRLRKMKREIPTAIPQKINKGGRPKGSRNKKTRSGADTPVGNSRSAHGRPKGSKNRKTLEREAAAAAERERRIAAGLPPEEPRPGRGRRKGSKNKKTLEREAAAAAERERRIAAGLPPEEPRRGRGRPKGSKNKKTLEREAVAAAENQQPIAGDLQPEDSKPSGPHSEPHDAAERPQTEDTGSGKKKPHVLTGARYERTLYQEKRDRELSRKTGIQIIQEDPPRPWDSKTRYQVNRGREKRRKQALAKLAEMERETQEKETT